MCLFSLKKFMNHFWNIKLNANISSEDVSNDSWKEKTCFNLSKYPNEYEYFDETNKKSLGNSKMKQNLKKSLILLA